VLGKTLENIRAECGMASIADLTPDNVKKQMKYCEIPAEVVWRKNILSEILLARDGQLVVENFSYDELNSILEDLCTGWAGCLSLVFTTPFTSRVDVLHQKPTNTVTIVVPEMCTNSINSNNYLPLLNMKILII
jgi:hypothetical protein